MAVLSENNLFHITKMKATRKHATTDIAPSVPNPATSCTDNIGIDPYPNVRNASGYEPDGTYVNA
jgi:hypothetical protein